ncbi:DUF3618 domain-containing protein [Qipengyuania sediminis]|uniref:DUF3618 domain-containing protein n=1 Tax=Qipengyuania sediminis TaxID=1532023 RepID=UPI001059C05A|nr:DUF3618 domain-containing protein [Qipengyuania sediminis]
MTASDQTTRDPAEIEREIRATQAEMSRTADQIGDQLTPRKLFNSLLDKADESGVDARYLLDGARRNPIALAMIALGGIWLVSESDAKASSLPKLKTPSFGKDRDSGSSYGGGSYHRDYVEHMSRYEPKEGEDELAYRRRRDLGRANYLMIEQRHDEDETSFRQRLDQATEKLRETRDSLLHSAQNLGSGARDSAGRLGRGTRDAASRFGTGTREAASRLGTSTQVFYSDNPLVGGAIAAVVGAIAGAAVPASRFEEEKIGSLGAQALDAAKEKARDLGDMAREKKDELVGQVQGGLETGQSASA